MNESNTSGDTNSENSPKLLSDDNIEGNLQYALLKEKLKNKYGASLDFTNNNEMWEITTSEGVKHKCTPEDKNWESYELNQFYVLDKPVDKKIIWPANNYRNELIADSEIESLWDTICNYTYVDRYKGIEYIKEELKKQNPKNNVGIVEKIKIFCKDWGAIILQLITTASGVAFVWVKNIKEFIPFLIITILCSVFFYYNGYFSRLKESPYSNQAKTANFWFWGSIIISIASVALIVFYPKWWPKIVGPSPEPTPTSTVIPDTQTPVIQTVVVVATPTDTPIATATIQPTPTPTPNHPNYKIKIGVFIHDSDSCSDTLERRNGIIEKLKELHFSVDEIYIDARGYEDRVAYYRKYDVLYMPFGWSCMGDDYQPFFGVIDEILGGKTGIFVGDPNIEFVDQEIILETFVDGYGFRFRYLSDDASNKLKPIYSNSVETGNSFYNKVFSTHTKNTAHYPKAGSKVNYILHRIKDDEKESLVAITSDSDGAPGLIIPNEFATNKNIRYAIMPGSEYGSNEDIYSIGRIYTERLIKWLADK